MKLTFIKAYKSVKTISNVDLPDFVVVTGVNGSGKTQLLEAISAGCVQLDDIDTNIKPNPIRLFNWTNLVPNDSGAFAPSQLTQEKYSLWMELSQKIETYGYRTIDYPLKNILENFSLGALIVTDIRTLISMKEEDYIAAGSSPEKAVEIVQGIQSIVSQATQNVINNFVQNEPNRRNLIALLQKDFNTSIFTLTEEDFFNNYPTHWMPVDMFQQSFGRLFAEYQRNWQSNQLRELGNKKGDNVTFLSDDEFIECYGEPPWDFLNNVLEAANLDFRINHPAKYEDRLYEPILTDKLRGNQVKFADLSSGERILMSFALCLYYAEDRRQIVEYPKVLLFDEIDAPLHPSMTQSLLRTIQEVLINRHKIKVILTTHSPSTVALALEESLFVMNKDGSKRLQKTTKDKALGILTSGVPTLSIDYENRRQVFVESKYDAEFYEQIYKKLRDKLIPEISLNFISSGVAGQGNCDQVKEVVNKLSDYGNRTVYGIIDWDLSNSGNDRIKVLGNNKRYSIENYILDPLLLAALLLREKWIERSEFNLEEGETYIDLGKFNTARLQEVANFVVNKIRVHLSSITNESIRTCEYIGGQKIDLPTWFLEMQGHRLEATLKQIFKQLNCFQKEGELKRTILLKVVDDIPQLISMDFIYLFQDIQNDVK